jgi:ADP-ribose pyrophosphatase YjhB (NUDIX family)
MNELIATLEREAHNPTKGLPDPLFYFVGRMTPFINVDLLIRDPQLGVLLTWRDDEYCGQGWHIPGGIIRLRETMHERVREVARLELNAEVSFIDDRPLRVNEVINFRVKDRSHFISLLFECRLAATSYLTIQNLSGLPDSKTKFFKTVPPNLLINHQIYADIF